MFSLSKYFFLSIVGILVLGISCLTLNLPKFFCLFFFVISYLIFFQLFSKKELSLLFWYSLLIFLVFFFSKKVVWFLLSAFFFSIESFLTILFILIPVAAYSLLDRKIMALVQRRKGPNVVGLWGLLQFLIDGIKLFFKEIILPSRSSSRWFILSPIIAASLSFTAWFALPVHPILNFQHISLDLLIVLTISSLNVYTTVLSGWSSNSRYAFLGSLRAIAQIISYELPMFFSLMPIIAYSGSLSLKSIVFSQTFVFFFWPFLPSALIFLICIVAETNRAPFDLPEAESELVAGYNTEYSSLVFAFFFISEYASMLLMSGLWINLFWGGFLPFFEFFDFIPGFLNFSLKMCFISFIFVFVRANLPRYRYDQFMNFGWKILLPVSFAFFIFSILICLNLDLFPEIWSSANF